MNTCQHGTLFAMQIHMLTFTVNERVYLWCGGFGAIFKSYERGVAVGDVRVIGDDIFYVYMVYRRAWGRREVSWSQLNVSVEHIKQIKTRFFGV